MHKIVSGDVNSIINRLVSSSNKPSYKPPYDSPIEDVFALNIVKYLNSYVKLIPQYKIETSKGVFRCDFALEISPYETILLECDGKKFHDFTKDRFRDAFILLESNIREIIRLSGKNINYYLEACLYFLRCCHPEIFSQRGQTNIDILAKNCGIEDSFKEPEEKELLWEEGIWIKKHNMYDDEFEDPYQDILFIRRHKKYFQHWQKLYDFAKENPHLNSIKELAALYDNNHGK